MSQSSTTAVARVQPELSASWSNTAIGYLAILCWSPTGLILSYLTHLPKMLVLAVSFSVCFVAITAYLTVTGRWYRVANTPKPLWCAGIFGIYGNNVCYLAAIQFAPITHVLLIGYLWPMTILFLNALFLKHQVSARQRLAALIAFISVALLITQGEANAAIAYPNAMWGYALALCSGSLWAVYCSVSQYYQKTPPEMIGMYCGVGAIVSFLYFFTLGETVAISLQSWVLMISLGLTAFGFAFIFWDRGMKYGHVKLLCVSAYLIPIFSTFLLYAFGQAVITPALLFALSGVTIGCFLARR